MQQQTAKKQKNDVFIASIAGIRFKSNNGFHIITVDVEVDGNKKERITAKCTSPVSLAVGQTIEITNGKWVNHSKYGRQYEIASFSIQEPYTSNDIEKYLSSGIIKGIGPTLAKRIVDAFGDKALEILDNEPKMLTQVRGVGDVNIDKIIASWKEQRRDAHILSQLCGMGLSVAYAVKAYKHFKGDAIDIIKSNPYALTAVYGIGFIKADEIGQKLGFTSEHPERLKAGVGYVLEQAMSSGHCYLTDMELLESAVGILGVKEHIIKEAIDDMEQEGKIVGVYGKYYLPYIYSAERYCDSKLSKLVLSTDSKTVAIDELLREYSHLTEEQTLAVKRGITEGLSIITGLPGTGKTFVTRTIIELLKRTGNKFALCAPTGKASKKLSESTGEEAQTIHRLLEFSPKSMTFGKNEENPLEYDYVIIDESSMIDIILLGSLLKAIEIGTKVIFIGDIDQLPSIGPGAVLKDMIGSGIFSVTRLTQVHRQARGSHIIRIAHEINKGEMPIIARKVSDGQDAIHIEADTPEDIQDIILNTIRSSGYSLHDIQVLVPIKKGPIGVRELNRLLQIKLNPNAVNNPKNNVGGYYVGDRVINIVNNYSKEVFNGEIGYIRTINTEDNNIVVEYDSKTLLYESDELDEIMLAYALTVHKSQGSQFPCVIVLMHTQYYIMLKRQLIYTAITRTQQLLYVIGQSKAISMAARNHIEDRRNTGLLKSMRHLV